MPALFPKTIINRYSLMNHYNLPGVQLDTDVKLACLQDFECDRPTGRRIMTLRAADEMPSADDALKAIPHREINVSVFPNGWQFALPHVPELPVYLNNTRDEMLIPKKYAPWAHLVLPPLLRTAIECTSALEGVVSLHSACVEMDGEAICFTAPSGTGKSTRAMQWIETLNAKFVSGDRPSVRLDGGKATVCGVPWDGKEGIFRNVRLPLKMICKIVRSDTVHARRLSKAEARQLLMQQCFVPMWDNDAAVAVMVTIRKLIDAVPIIELHCGPDADAARQAYDLIYHHPEKILEEK